MFKNEKNLNQDGRLLGLDIGTKIIGVAICDRDQNMANPLLNISRKGNRRDFPALEKIILENQITGIVIGLPLGENEEKTPMSDFVERFAKNFNEFLQEKNLKIKIAFQNENLSSFAARSLKQGARQKHDEEKIDKIAASLILQDYLDTA